MNVVLEGYITVQEASEIAGITEGYIRRMLIADSFDDLKRGLDYVKLGKIWLIKKKSWVYHTSYVNNKKRLCK